MACAIAVAGSNAEVCALRKLENDCEAFVARICAAFSLRDIMEDKLGFVGEIVYFMRDSVSRSAQETFWKKFLKNLQKL